MNRFLTTLILFTVFFRANYSFSQETAFFKVTYTKELYSKLDSSKSNYHKRQINNLNFLLNKNSKKVEYHLIIENYHSIFYSEILKMNNDSQGFQKLTSQIGGTRGKFYINKKDSIFYNKKHFGGDDFKIKLNIKKWKITNEFKFIRNFKSYKAISEDVILNPNGKFKFKVIAWFCPDLPSFFGPANYFGLPGLILELDNGKSILQVKEIRKSKSLKEKVILFKKGIELSQKEYNDLVKKKANEKYGKFMN